MDLFEDFILQTDLRCRVLAYAVLSHAVQY